MKGRQKFMEEWNAYDMIKLIQKLKATVSILVNNDETLIK